MLNYAGSHSKIAKKLVEYLEKLELLPEVGDNRNPISAAIMIDGKLIAAAPAGTSGSGNPATIDGLYNIGSVSKIYSTVAVLKLVELGLCTLDDYVYQLLPDFYTRDERYKKIKVHMILDHSSGLTGSCYRNAFGSEWKFSKFIDDMYDFWHNEKMKAEPGEFSVYCNEGFDLAAALVECLSGMKYYDFIKKYFFDPIGINSTAIGDARLDCGEMVYMQNCKPEFLAVHGAGGIRTNIIDCAKFGNIFLNSNNIISQELLNKTALPWGKTFLKNDEFSALYGLGWDSVSFSNESIDLGEGTLAKGGTTLQFNSHLVVSKKYNLSASLSMVGGYKKGSDDILFQLIAIVLKELDIANVYKTISSINNTKKPIPQNIKERIEGYYSATTDINKIEVNDDTVYIKKYDGNNEWINETKYPTFKYNGKFFFSEDPDSKFNKLIFEQANENTYMLMPLMNLMCPLGQKILSMPPLTKGWINRLDKQYLLCNYILTAQQVMPGMHIIVTDLLHNGVLSFKAVTAPGAPATYTHVVCCGDDDTNMFSNAPGMGCRDLYAPFITKDKQGNEILNINGNKYIEASAVSTLKSEEFSIEPGFKNKLFKINKGMQFSCTLPVGTALKIFNDNLEQIYSVEAKLSEESLKILELQDGYAMFANDEGCKISCNIQ